MWRLLSFTLAALLALGGCALTAEDGRAPAPLAATQIDEQALDLAYHSFEVALTAIDGMRDTGRLVPGTPAALRVQRLIRTAQAGFDIAYKVRAGLSDEDGAAALQSAGVALRELSVLLQGEGQ